MVPLLQAHSLFLQWLQSSAVFSTWQFQYLLCVISAHSRSRWPAFSCVLWSLCVSSWLDLNLWESCTPKQGKTSSREDLIILLPVARGHQPPETTSALQKKVVHRSHCCVATKFWARGEPGEQNPGHLLFMSISALLPPFWPRFLLVLWPSPTPCKSNGAPKLYPKWDIIAF